MTLTGKGSYQCVISIRYQGSYQYQCYTQQQIDLKTI